MVNQGFKVVIDGLLCFLASESEPSNSKWYKFSSIHQKLMKTLLNCSDCNRHSLYQILEQNID